MNLLKTTLAALILAVPLASLARSNDTVRTPRFDQRQTSQERRIDQGVRSGALTRHEAVRLYQGQRRLQALESRIKADGRVTGRERAWLQQAQKEQSRSIYQQKHDRQRAFAPYRQATHRYYVYF